MLRREVLDKSSGAILFKKPKGVVSLEDLKKEVDSLKKENTALKKRVTKLESAQKESS